MYNNYLKKYAQGGTLTHFNEGGSHEENPLGGIPMGQSSNGQLDTVEEGETKQNDFIFSDRITFTKDVIEEFNLPKNLEGKTIAEATKIIDNKFKDRTDKISTSTKDKMLGNIANAQESIKAKRENLSEALDNNATEIPDLPEQNQMFLGGNQTDTTTDSTLGNIDVGEYLNMGKSAFDFADNVFGKTESANRNVDGTVDVTRVKAGNSALSGATKGAQAGMVLGPWGAVVGGAIGAGAGLIKANKMNKIADQQEINNKIIATGKYSNDFALGGNIKFRKDSNDPNSLPTLNYNSTLDPNYIAKQDLLITEGNLPTLDIGSTRATDEQLRNGSLSPKFNYNKVADWGKNNAGEILRYTPIAMNALELAKLKKAPNTRLNRLDNRYQPQYVDERTLQNSISNESDNTINALTSATNGSTGSLRNSILAAGLNKTKALSDAYINIDAQNRQENTNAQRFNLNIDESNNRTDMIERDINDRNSAAYENNKSKLKSQLATDIGEVGKEQVYKKIARETLGYTWDGRYWVKPDGSKVSDKEVEKEVKSTSNQKKLGGIMLKNK